MSDPYLEPDILGQEKAGFRDGYSTMIIGKPSIQSVEASLGKNIHGDNISPLLFALFQNDFTHDKSVSWIKYYCHMLPVFLYYYMRTRLSYLTKMNMNCSK